MVVINIIRIFGYENIIFVAEHSVHILSRARDGAREDIVACTTRNYVPHERLARATIRLKKYLRTNDYKSCAHIQLE